MEARRPYRCLMIVFGPLPSYLAGLLFIGLSATALLACLVESRRSGRVQLDFCEAPRFVASRQRDGPAHSRNKYRPARGRCDLDDEAGIAGCTIKYISETSRHFALGRCAGPRRVAGHSSRACQGQRVLRFDMLSKSGCRCTAPPLASTGLPLFDIGRP
jgi:hypothetical protein